MSLVKDMVKNNTVFRDCTCAFRQSLTTIGVGDAVGESQIPDSGIIPVKVSICNSESVQMEPNGTRVCGVYYGVSCGTAVGVQTNTESSALLHQSCATQDF